MIGDVHTIRFPYRCPDLRVRETGAIASFSALPAASLFVLLDEPGRVYEKLPPDQMACLVPWEYEIYDAPRGDAWCRRLEPIL